MPWTSSPRWAPRRCACCWLLSDGTPRTLRQITDELHLEQSTVNRQVNTAMREGYLHRSRTNSASSYLFEPTSFGRETFDRETTAVLGRYRDALDRLGPDDAGQLLDLFGRFVDLYGQSVEKYSSTDGQSTPA